MTYKNTCGKVEKKLLVYEVSVKYRHEQERSVIAYFLQGPTLPLLLMSAMIIKKSLIQN